MRNLDIATKTQEQISEELDVTLLESVRTVKSALKHARRASGGAGAELGDIRGAAALLNVARQRMRDLGISKAVTPGDAAALLAQEIGASLTDMPEDELEEELDAGSSRQQEVGRIPEAAR